MLKYFPVMLLRLTDSYLYGLWCPGINFISIPYMSKCEVKLFLMKCQGVCNIKAIFHFQLVEMVS